MSSLEKENLARLAFYEACKRGMDSVEHLPQEKQEFEHTVELMREHERLENSSMGVKWVLEEHSQISLHLGGTYEQQGFGATTKTKKNTKNQKNKKERRMLPVAEFPWQL